MGEERDPCPVSTGLRGPPRIGAPLCSPGLPTGRLSGRQDLREVWRGRPERSWKGPGLPRRERPAARGGAAGAGGCAVLCCGGGPAPAVCAGCVERGLPGRPLGCQLGPGGGGSLLDLRAVRGILLLEEPVAPPHSVVYFCQNGLPARECAAERSPFTQFWGRFSIGYGALRALLLWNVDPFWLAVESQRSTHGAGVEGWDLSAGWIDFYCCTAVFTVPTNCTVCLVLRVS